MTLVTKGPGAMTAHAGWIASLLVACISAIVYYGKSVGEFEAQIAALNKQVVDIREERAILMVQRNRENDIRDKVNDRQDAEIQELRRDVLAHCKGGR